MFQRSSEDIAFINNKKPPVREVQTWCKDLFLENRKIHLEVPDEVILWGISVFIANFKKAKTPLARTLVLKKILHTHEILQAGYDILEIDASYSWNRYQIGMLCFLHDIGRFPQALKESFSDHQTQLDHADLGAQMIQEKTWQTLTDYNIDLPTVIKAVSGHNKKTLPSTDPYALFIRDADKLGILRHFKDLTENSMCTADKFTQERLSEFLRSELVNNRNIISISDWYLVALSWFFDVNFETTQNLLHSCGCLEEIKILLMEQDVPLYNSLN